jgi:hypothetical protein
MLFVLLLIIAHGMLGVSEIAWTSHPRLGRVALEGAIRLRVYAFIYTHQGSGHRLLWGQHSVGHIGAGDPGCRVTWRASRSGLGCIEARPGADVAHRRRAG